MSKWQITHYESVKKDKEFNKLLDYNYDGNLLFQNVANHVEDVFGKISVEDSEEKRGAMFTTAHLMYHVENMKIKGEKIYHIPKNLFKTFSKMNINARLSDIDFPADEIFISFDQDELKIRSSERPYSANIGGAYVNFDFDMGIFRMLAVSTFSKSPIYSTCVFMPMYLEGNTVQDLIDHNIGLLNNGVVKKLDEGFEIDTMSKMFRIIMNTLVYMTGDDADVEPCKGSKLVNTAKGNKAIKKFEKKVKKTHELDYVIIGPKLSRDMAEFHALGLRRSWKISFQFSVKKHNRKQWVGSKKEGTRRQVDTPIASYTKGNNLRTKIRRYLFKDVEGVVL